MPAKTTQGAKKHDTSRDRLNSANTRLLVHLSWGKGVYSLAIALYCTVKEEGSRRSSFGPSGQKLNLQLKSGTLEEVVEKVETRVKATM